MKLRDYELKEDQKLQLQLQMHDNEMQFNIKKSIDEDTYKQNKAKYEANMKDLDIQIRNTMEDVLALLS
jgi:hypothetical protein